MSLAFKFDIEFEKNEDGSPVFELKAADGTKQYMAVPKTLVTPTIEAAIAHCMEAIGSFVYPDGTIKQITRIHFKDVDTGEYFNLVKCTAVIDHAVSDLPRVRSMADAPKVVVP